MLGTLLSQTLGRPIDRLSVVAFSNDLVLSKISANIKAQFQQNLSSMFMKPSKGIFEHNSSVFHVEILHIGISEKI